MTLKHNPWGRLVESSGEGGAPDLVLLESMFREVGLHGDDAAQAARGLEQGVYQSFAEAAHNRRIWGSALTQQKFSHDKVNEVTARLAAAETEARAKELRHELSEAVRAKFPYNGSTTASTASLRSYDQERSVVEFEAPDGVFTQRYEISESGAVSLVGTPIAKHTSGR